MPNVNGIKPGFAQTGLQHPLSKLLVRRKLADAIWQIVVRTGIVLCQRLADTRQDIFEVPAVHAFDRLPTRHGKLEDRDLTTRLAHTSHLSQTLIGVRDIPQPKSGGYNLKVVRLKRELLSVGFHKLDVATGSFATFLFTNVKHLVAEIGSDHRDRKLGFLFKSKRQISRSATAVQNRIVSIGIQASHRFPPPIMIDIHRKQVVHPIVFRRNFTKHVTYTLIRFVDGHNEILSAFERC